MTAGTILHFYVERPFISIGKRMERIVSGRANGNRRVA
jgi:hypothetical protein